MLPVVVTVKCKDGEAILMRSRVKELHYDYCAVKPERFFTLWDTDKVQPPADDSPEVAAERESINIYIHLLV